MTKFKLLSNREIAREFLKGLGHFAEYLKTMKIDVI